MGGVVKWRAPGSAGATYRAHQSVHVHVFVWWPCI